MPTGQSELQIVENTFTAILDAYLDPLPYHRQSIDTFVHDLANFTLQTAVTSFCMKKRARRLTFDDYFAAALNDYLIDYWIESRRKKLA